eukprot:1162106-Pelagomonas_calceolata.AAC.1
MELQMCKDRRLAEISNGLHTNGRWYGFNQMSDENPNKKARVPKGKSGGAYKLKLGVVGPTDKFQASWFKDPPADGQPRREHWLLDKGQ